MSKLKKVFFVLLTLFAGIHAYAGGESKFSYVLSGTQTAPRILACMALMLVYPKRWLNIWLTG